MRISIKEGTRLVNFAVLGEEIHSVSVADSWTIGFSNGTWLLAQNVVCSGEERINALLGRAEPEVLSREDVTKALLLVSYMRRPVTECSIASDGTLTLVFDKSRVLQIPTDTDIVDWQWSLSPTGTGEPLSPYQPSDPYAAPSIVACLWSGELEGPSRGLDKPAVGLEEPSNAWSELAAFLDASGVTRREKGFPIWESGLSGRRYRFFFGHSSDSRPRILEALLESGDSVFLTSVSSPLEDPDLADLEWLPAAVDAWRVPNGLSIWTFLNSGFAADVSYRLSVHGSESPELRFSENMLVGTIEPYLENLRSHGVEAVFVSGPHFGWGLALPTL